MTLFQSNEDPNKVSEIYLRKIGIRLTKKDFENYTEIDSLLWTEEEVD